MKDKLMRFSLSLVGHTAEAEDIVQEVMIRIWDRRQQWPRMENLEGYCMRMTRNISIDRLRKRKDRLESLNGAVRLPSAEPSPLQALENRELIGRVRICMENMPEKLRTVIRLREMEGMSYQDIAMILDITLSQVRINLHRARIKLREELLKPERHVTG